MSDLVEMLALPFLACLLLGGILSYLGIHVLKREVIFIDIAVAQVAAIGALVAHLLFHVEEDSLISYLGSLVCVLAMAGFYALVRHRVLEISVEAVIGISYAITAAGAMFLMGVVPGHNHAHEMLAGALLWIMWPQMLTSLLVCTAVGVVLWLFRRPLAAVSEDYARAAARGMKVVWWDFFFYALLGTVITVAVRISGVVTVFALLIIPATTSALFATAWLPRMLLAWLTVLLGSAGGLLFSYYLDFSVGPTIALCLGVLLAASAALLRLRARPMPESA
ncbi:MAG: metal ABC transporter permease [Planctomycetes bacterium]|nr:metal ABC transporter permease [Planctomycetota bacterium]